MARVNVDILGISELKWTGMGEFNSDDHYIYCGQESLKRNEIAIIVNKRVQNTILGCNLKNNKMTLLAAYFIFILDYGNVRQKANWSNFLIQVQNGL